MLRVRGAPLLGAAAGFGVALAAYIQKQKPKRNFSLNLRMQAIIKCQRPTAVNLFWGVDGVLNKAETFQATLKQSKQAVISGSAENCR